MSSILIYGPSGSGKSTAIENLNPKFTGIICSDSKELPFRGWKKNYVTKLDKDGKMSIEESNYIETKKPISILKILRGWNARPEIKTIVWDTMTHAIMYRFMTDPKVDWDFYKILAKEIYQILNYIQQMKTKNVIVIGHSDVKLDASGTKIDAVRTIGEKLAKIYLIAGISLELITLQRKNETSKRECLKSYKIGQSAAKLRIGERSQTIPVMGSTVINVNNYWKR